MLGDACGSAVLWLLGIIYSVYLVLKLNSLCIEIFMENRRKHSGLEISFRVKLLFYFILFFRVRFFKLGLLFYNFGLREKYKDNTESSHIPLINTSMLTF